MDYFYRIVFSIIGIIGLVIFGFWALNTPSGSLSSKQVNKMISENKNIQCKVEIIKESNNYLDKITTVSIPMEVLNQISNIKFIEKSDESGVMAVVGGEELIIKASTPNPTNKEIEESTKKPITPFKKGLTGYFLIISLIITTVSLGCMRNNENNLIQKSRNTHTAEDFF